MLMQRVYELCLRYEDLIDHDLLRGDPLLALLCGKKDLEGKQRRNERDRGKALAGKSALNRLETAGSLLSGRPRHKKIVAEMARQCMDKGQDTRFVVTNMSADEYEAQYIYEKLNCARGGMENRIK
jgi:hypothetical protein